MASIIGHTFTGIITKQIIKTKLSPNKEKLLLCISVFLALMPDFDIIIYVVFKPFFIYNPIKLSKHTTSNLCNKFILTQFVKQIHDFSDPSTHILLMNILDFLLWSRVHHFL